MQRKSFLTAFLCLMVSGIALSQLPQGSGNQQAQQVDSSKPLKIAHQYRNDYNFEDALEWYEKVIKDFPGTQAAAEASLNKIAILHTQAAVNGRLSMDFLILTRAKLDEASNYRSTELRLEALSEAGKLKAKADNYSVKETQVGKKLREEFYRFEREYARFMEKLPIPWVPLPEGKPSIAIVSEDNAQKILLLGLVPDLEFKTRIKYLNKIFFQAFCLQYMALGGETPTEGITLQWSSSKYRGRINKPGFYCWLGVELLNSCQYKAALKAFEKVIALTQNDPYNKLRYKSEKKKKELMDNWKEYLKAYPSEAHPFAEKLESGIN